jgi:trk system potassium uptake protein TrkH
VIDTIILVFMIAAGVNFALYFALLRRRFSAVYRDPELRFYLFLLVTGSVIVIAALLIAGKPIIITTGEPVEAGFFETVRFGVFSVATSQTTTGFCTSDFDRWPFIAKAVLLTLMFIGGSAGSTGGGIKVIRIWIMLKVMIAELERVFRPQVVRPLKIGSSSIDNEYRLATVSYVIGIVLLFAIGSVAIMVLEQRIGYSPHIKYTTAATASIATLCNIGPGLDLVGPLQNYGWFCDASKLVMSLLMALGRLEVFAIIVLFSPRFWRGD